MPRPNGGAFSGVAAAAVVGTATALVVVVADASSSSSPPLQAASTRADALPMRNWRRLSGIVRNVSPQSSVSPSMMTATMPEEDRDEAFVALYRERYDP